MIEFIVLGAGAGSLLGFVIGFAIPNYKLERRRWKAIWQLEKWCADLQEELIKLEEFVGSE